MGSRRFGRPSGSAPLGPPRPMPRQLQLDRLPDPHVARRGSRWLSQWTARSGGSREIASEAASRRSGSSCWRKIGEHPLRQSAFERRARFGPRRATPGRSAAPRPDRESGRSPAPRWRADRGLAEPCQERRGDVDRFHLRLVADSHVGARQVPLPNGACRPGPTFRPRCRRPVAAAIGDEGAWPRLAASTRLESSPGAVVSRPADYQTSHRRATG